MLAFGSLVFSIWRGFGNLGTAMFIGVGACFLSTTIILFGIIGLLERKNKQIIYLKIVSFFSPSKFNR